MSVNSQHYKFMSRQLLHLKFTSMCLMRFIFSRPDQSSRGGGGGVLSNRTRADIGGSGATGRRGLTYM